MENGHPIVWRGVLGLNPKGTYQPSKLPDFSEMDGGLNYTNDVMKMYEVARAGGQEAYAESLTKHEVEEEYFKGSLIKTFKQGGKTFKVETWRGGVLQGVLDGEGRSLDPAQARFEKHGESQHTGALAKMFSTADDRDVINERSVQAGRRW